ncbi:Beta-galactosidase, domain 3 [Actinacidiphila yanglinensis]|uniref:beta-galactosidase n=1 Tax=Actinacidiphila yanglinensis TaxID=310779 RepID=A0A1H6D868_9ACTN|nr:beta-galactosidase [Actinacidiphila yanglinensis]SEG81073.1 Beta-galactosidase, domain 3 [Actinacidiphila yanglinensis]
MSLSRRTFAALTGAATASLALPHSAGAATPGSAVSPAVRPQAGPSGATHTVTFDRYSLIVDGERVPLWSGEVHPFRLPSPSLWRDILQKLAASGYNAVSIYASWNYHSPAPGTYDFTGVRDIGRFLDMAAEEGLYVIVRPGPYINGETDAGGYPGWLTATTGRARTNDPTYLGYADEWLTALNAEVAPRQYSGGGGTVVLYQLENEYASFVTSATGKDYMAHLYAKVRSDGIEVPLFHNDKGRNGYWVPGSFDTGGETGRYLYAFDGYPSASGNPPDWGVFGTGGATGGSTASPDTPGFMAEFGGGWFDCWGGAEFAGQGYAGSRAARNAAYERRFYLTNLANGIRIHNVYMTFGGTSWGWLPAPVVYTSYDYGAAIDEARNLTDKVTPMKQIGSLLSAFPDLAELDRAADTAASSTSVHVYHLSNSDRGSHLYLLRNDTTKDAFCTLPVDTAAGPLTVPAAAGGLKVSAKDGTMLATNLSLGRRALLYATAQPMWRASGDAQDIAVFTGRPGDPVEIVLLSQSAPRVSVTSGAADTAYDTAAGTLRINAVLDGLTVVRLDGGGYATPLVVVLADDAAAATLWPRDTDAGSVLVSGPALVRGVRVTGRSVHLTGDTTAPSDLRVWSDGPIAAVEWNGKGVAVSATRDGSLLARKPLPGPGAVPLPVLKGWRYAAENPESDPRFDDSAWRTCDLTTSHSTTALPAGQPAVLFADDYGFHYGDVWYRAEVADAATAEDIVLSYQTGTLGLLMAWWDGRPLGTHRMPVPTLAQATTGTWSATAQFGVPEDLRGDGPHTLALLVRRMAHDEDGGANDGFKSARGLTAATLDGAPLTWRIQGATGDDTARGPLNTGGLYGERAGWHLPGFPDRDWAAVTLPYTDTRQGVAWYRSGFTLAVDPGTDASIGLTFTDDPARAYRVQIFLNGWNIGQYANDVGPQHTFVLPNGILRTRGANTLALAVLSDGSGPAGPALPALTLLGAAAGGTPVEDVASPGYRPAGKDHRS